ncbi:MAG: hypothetical protein KF878_11920 [Planctomycetes bacterium]|nr:hypothetical protein [Planctomycetota bacterium]
MGPRSASSRPSRLRALGAAALSAGLALLLAFGGAAALVPLSALLPVPIEERPEEHHRTPETVRVALAMAASEGCRAARIEEAHARPWGRRPARPPRAAASPPRIDVFDGFSTPLRC